MTNTPKPQANTLDEILESFGEDVADQYGGDSDTHGLVGLETAKQQIQALITKARVEAFQHGLITGAMPEAIGKPIAQNYLTQLKENKDDQKG